MSGLILSPLGVGGSIEGVGAEDPVAGSALDSEEKEEKLETPGIFNEMRLREPRFDSLVVP